MEPQILHAADRVVEQLYDVSFVFGPGASATDGTLGIVEVVIPPRTLVKPHRHRGEDEFSVVLDGTIGVRLGAETVEAVSAGGCLVKPRGLPHALWNATDEPARILEILSPGGFERYFQEVAPILREHGPEWTQRFYETAERYGVEVLDDWSKELQERYGITL